jgi:hypothetical protein
MAGILSHKEAQKEEHKRHKQAGEDGKQAGEGP